MGMKVRAQRVDDYHWRVPRQGKMRVDGIIFASSRLMEDLHEDPTLEQVANVTSVRRKN